MGFSGLKGFGFYSFLRIRLLVFSKDLDISFLLIQRCITACDALNYFAFCSISFDKYGRKRQIGVLATGPSGFPKKGRRPRKASTIRYSRPLALTSRLSPVLYLISHLNNRNFPLKLGYLMAGSNQQGVFNTGFCRVKVSKVNLP